MQVHAPMGYRDGLKEDPRFCDFEVKNLRSPTCSRQDKAIFPPHIHRTWGPPVIPDPCIPLSKSCTSSMVAGFAAFL